MRTLVVTVAVALFTADCATKSPDTPASQPQPVATATPSPATQQPAAKPEEPTAAKPEEPTAVKPPTPTAVKPATPPAAKPATTAKTPSAPQAPNPAARTGAASGVAAPRAAAVPAPLDLVALKERLKATKAIGVFTKMALKNQVDDLMGKFRLYYQGKAKVTMTELRRSYDLLMMKVLSLLQDSDQKLASDIVSSREAIWGLLADPQKFAALQS
jgi:hypothetical protein